VVQQALETAALMLGTDKTAAESQRWFFRFLGREQQEKSIWR
jgi:hypothetical protein